MAQRVPADPPVLLAFPLRRQSQDRPGPEGQRGEARRESAFLGVCAPDQQSSISDGLNWPMSSSPSPSGKYAKDYCRSPSFMGVPQPGSPPRRLPCELQRRRALLIALSERRRWFRPDRAARVWPRFRLSCVQPSFASRFFRRLRLGPAFYEGSFPPLQRASRDPVASFHRFPVIVKREQRRAPVRDLIRYMQGCSCRLRHPSCSHRD